MSDKKLTIYESELDLYKAKIAGLNKENTELRGAIKEIHRVASVVPQDVAILKVIDKLEQK